MLVFFFSFSAVAQKKSEDSEKVLPSALEKALQSNRAALNKGEASSKAIAYWAPVVRVLQKEATKNHALKKRLQQHLQKSHRRLSYKGLWRAFETTDAGRCGDKKNKLIFDFYSAKCWRPADKCTRFKREGDCFNREHSWPKSWYKGKKSSTPYTDLHVVLPSDGYVNSRRGNFPYGEVGLVVYESSNGSKSGNCKDPKLGRRCFEPANALKGDLARAHFYFSARYVDIFRCCKKEAVDRAMINPHHEALLLKWHQQDPVDDAERGRNEAVFKVQGNRNPFVDYPEWVEAIADF